MKSIFTHHRKREQLAGYLFILPNFLGFALFVLFPILVSLFLIFTEWDYLQGFNGLEFVGLKNFMDLRHDEYFLPALKNNFIFTVVVVPVSMVIGLLVAIVLNKYVYLKGLLRMLFFLPYVSSLVAMSVVWAVMYNATDGPINAVLRSIGLENPPGWLSSPSWALISIMILTIWINVGYTMVLFLAGLQGVPKDLYEASEIDGANKLRQFFHITVPMLAPTTFLVAITLMISSFQVFAAVAVMTQGGPINSTMVIVYHIYLQAFKYYKMSYAATLSWILFIIIFLITLVQWKGQKKWSSNF
jgi:multiple sugar transport system permease protein